MYTRTSHVNFLCVWSRTVSSWAVRSARQTIFNKWKTGFCNIHTFRGVVIAGSIHLKSESRRSTGRYYGRTYYHERKNYSFTIISPVFRHSDTQKKDLNVHLIQRIERQGEVIKDLRSNKPLTGISHSNDYHSHRIHISQTSLKSLNRYTQQVRHITTALVKKYKPTRIITLPSLQTTLDKYDLPIDPVKFFLYPWTCY